MVVNPLKPTQKHTILFCEKNLQKADYKKIYSTVPKI